MCKTQGELSSENTFCLQDCSNVSVEVSAKIRFSAGKSHLNFYFISKDFPGFNFYLLLCLYNTPFQRGRWSGIISSSHTGKAPWGDDRALQQTLSLYSWLGHSWDSPALLQPLKGTWEQKLLCSFHNCSGWNGARLPRPQRYAHVLILQNCECDLI